MEAGELSKIPTQGWCHHWTLELSRALEKRKLFMPGGTEVECQQYAAELGGQLSSLMKVDVPVGTDAIGWVGA